MAGFTRTNGDLQPVVVMDSGVGNAAGTAGWNNGANAVISGVTVQPWGPKLNFYTVEGANIDNASTESGNVQLIIQTVQQLSTIAMYEWTDAGSNGTLALALYDNGAWANSITFTPANAVATLQTALQAVVSAVVVSNSATFTTTAF